MYIASIFQDFSQRSACLDASILHMFNIYFDCDHTLCMYIKLRPPKPIQSHSIHIISRNVHWVSGHGE